MFVFDKPSAAGALLGVGDIATPTAGYSLRPLSIESYGRPVVKVRRSSDNTEKDFTSQEITDGALESWIHSANESPADYGAGAAAAYSLRYVSDSYTGNVVRVRRSVDNAEQDFTPSEITDGTLLAWVGTTASDHGHVTTWYDQSGNSNDATQATAASQPKIVDAGVLVEEDGRPALDFTTNNAVLRGLLSIASDITFFATGRIPTDTLDALFELHQSGSNRFIVRANSGAYEVFDQFSSGTYSNNQILFSAHITASASDAMYINGANTETGSFSKLTTSDIAIGNDNTLSDSSIVQELIIYNSDQSANRETIEANINKHYGIYTPTVDGFVSKWYDQFGSNDATQTSASNQPKIWDASTGLLTEGGRPAIEFDGSDDFLSAADSDTLSFTDGSGNDLPISAFATFKLTGGTSTKVLFGKDNGSPNREYAWGYFLSESESRFFLKNNGGNDQISRDNKNAGQLNLHQTSTMLYDASEIANGITFYSNGIIAAMGDAVSQTYNGMANTSADFTIGNYGAAISNFGGIIQEIIIYNTDQSANRTKIEDNINVYYVLYGLKHYRQRVLADSGTFALEGRDALVYNSVTISEMPSLICSCDAYKATKLYNINPA